MWQVAVVIVSQGAKPHPGDTNITAKRGVGGQDGKPHIIRLGASEASMGNWYSTSKRDLTAEFFTEYQKLGLDEGGHGGKN